MHRYVLLGLSLNLFLAAAVHAQEPPTLEIVWPPADAEIGLGKDVDGSVGIVVKSNFRLLASGQCGEDLRCGHVHLKIDPSGHSCNIPGQPYNSMNSDFGGDLIKARFRHCPTPAGIHVIGVVLADDSHKPVLINGKPVVALIKVRTK